MTLIRPWCRPEPKKRKASGLGHPKGYSPERQARRGSAFFRDFGGPDIHAAIVRSGCCRCGRRQGKIDVAHLVSRGAGGGLEVEIEPGKFAGNVIPLCRRCHREQHNGRWSVADHEHARAVADSIHGDLYVTGVSS